MKLKSRIVKTIALIMLLTISLSSTTFANNFENHENIIANQDDFFIAGTPNISRWSYTSSVSEGLTISSNGTATISAVVSGYHDLTTKIVIFFDLQKYTGGVWKKVKTYRDTTNGWYTLEEHSYAGLDKGYKYRVKCTYYVYSGDNYEYFIRYTAEKSY